MTEGSPDLAVEVRRIAEEARRIARDTDQAPAVERTLQRLDEGQGKDGDIELLLDLCENILGRSFCALGDGATSPITSAIQHFRSEFESGMHTPSRELFPPAASTLFAQEETSGSESK